MSNNATKQDVQDIVDKAMQRQSEDFAEIFSGFAAQVDERFNKVESDIADIKSSIDRLTNTIDGFLKRLDEVESEQVARDAQFEKLLVWAREVSEKTGIPLKGL